MSSPTNHQKTPARPLLSEADYTKRGRQLTERKALEHRRAREEREARGEVKIWTYVPHLHVTLIRSLVADICAALNMGRSPEQILSWRKDAAAKTASALPFNPGAALSARGNSAHAGSPGQDEGADDPAEWRGQGIKARRGAQRRRAAARKKAGGLERISLVVPEVFRATILAVLAQIVARLKEGLLPTVEVTASGCAETAESRPEETRAEASVAPLSCATTSTVSGGQDAQNSADGEVPIRQAEEGPASQVPSNRDPCGLAPPDAVLPRIEPRWHDATRLPEGGKERSPLFDDIHMLSWLARSRLPTSGAGG